MSHLSVDDTLINATLGRALNQGRTGFFGDLETLGMHPKRHRGHSEPTVELNHPIESGILTNVEDYFDNNSETQEIVFPFNSEQAIELDDLESQAS